MMPTTVWGNSARFLLVVLLCATGLSKSRADTLVETDRSTDKFSQIEPLVTAAIADGQTPGAVIVVANQTEILYARAFGHRQVQPTSEAMTLDTVFDLASITKPVATATAIMKLADRGKIDVNKKVVTYLPEFHPHEKDEILVSDLLLHMGGLVADNSLKDYREGPDLAWQRICNLKPMARRGEKFVYSDVGFIVLGKLVQKVSGVGLDEFCRREIYQPLGMQQTTFNPPAELRSRAAATEQRDGEVIKGVVHDPRAHLMGGVAGHAGLFAPAGDLVKYGRSLLDASHGESQLLSRATFDMMIQPRDILRGTRTYGWDHRSPYSSNRGERFSDQGFGHGGFTGTVLWIDPQQELIFIFLSTRLHPDGKGSINKLAGRIATLIAADQ